MHYRILIFNHKSIRGFDEKELRNHLLDVNFETLCDQYQLDSTQIEPVKSYLEVIASKQEALPYFLVKYGKNQQRSIIVNELDVLGGRGNNVLQDWLQHKEYKKITDHLESTRFIIEIELTPHQLIDMGLLLAYEIARWAAGRGEGVVLGLDNTWYRLNQHRAFIPINEAQ